MILNALRTLLLRKFIYCRRVIWARELSRFSYQNIRRYRNILTDFDELQRRRRCNNSIRLCVYTTLGRLTHLYIQSDQNFIVRRSRYYYYPEKRSEATAETFTLWMQVIEGSPCRM